jgi:large subunit ribosomal protein L5
VSEDETAEKAAAPAKKAPARKAAVKKTAATAAAPANKAAAKKAAVPAKKAAAKKASAPAKKAAAKKAVSPSTKAATAAEPAAQKPEELDPPAPEAPAAEAPAAEAPAEKAEAPAAEAPAEKAPAAEAPAEKAPAAEAPAEKAPAASKNGSTAPAKSSGRGAPPAGSRPRLKERYLAEYRVQLQSDLGLRNVMEVPGLEKIVINMGVGRATQQQSLIEGAQRDLQVITGQKPIVTRAKKSIAGFKLREGQAIGVKVTLRGDRAWEFFDRLISLAIPRIRDFRGLSPRSFDGRGNYTFGVVEQLIFPEIDYDRIDTIRGMDITIVTTAHTDEHGRALLRAFGFPFRQETR